MAVQVPLTSRTTWGNGNYEDMIRLLRPYVREISGHPIRDIVSSLKKSVDLTVISAPWETLLEIAPD